ncbi:MAG: hypothetical protein EBT93_10155 [Alphaproteobacteria bacterium]|nr:hypothetical protein [Alphaproteobacteria bacterium]
MSYPEIRNGWDFVQLEDMMLSQSCPQFPTIMSEDQATNRISRASRLDNLWIVRVDFLPIP